MLVKYILYFTTAIFLDCVMRNYLQQGLWNIYNYVQIFSWLVPYSEYDLCTHNRCWKVAYLIACNAGMKYLAPSMSYILNLYYILIFRTAGMKYVKILTATHRFVCNKYFLLICSLKFKLNKFHTNTAAAFLTGVAGASMLGGFGMTLGMAKKKDPHMFNKGMMGARELQEAGGALAMRALGWGTFYAVTGFSIFCFCAWKLTGSKDVSSSFVIIYKFLNSFYLCVLLSIDIYSVLVYYCLLIFAQHQHIQFLFVFPL